MLVLSLLAIALICIFEGVRRVAMGAMLIGSAITPELRTVTVNGRVCAVLGVASVLMGLALFILGSHLLLAQIA